MNKRCFFFFFCSVAGMLLWNNGYSQTVLVQEPFENANFTARGWYDFSGIGLSSAEHVAGSASSAQFYFPQGAATPSGGKGGRILFTPSEEVFITYWVKYSANWTEQSLGFHHEFLLMTNKNGAYDGPAFSHLTAYIERNTVGPHVSIQDGQNIDQSKIYSDLTNTTEDRSIAGCNGNWPDGYSNVSCYDAGGGTYWNGKQWRAGAAAISAGAWHQIGAYFKLNSISGGKGIGDGVLGLWLDGIQVVNRTNVLYRTAKYPDMKWNQFMILLYIGDGSPVSQSFWMDNLVIMNGLPPSGISPAKDAKGPSLNGLPPTMNGTRVDFSALCDQTGDWEIKIYEPTGKQVFHKKAWGKSPKTQGVAWKPESRAGLYMLALRNAGKKTVHKIAVMR